MSTQELRPSVAFTALALFNVMRFPLTMLPMIISFVVEGRTALTRVRMYLMADEVDSRYYANCGEKVNMLIVHRAWKIGFPFSTPDDMLIGARR